MLGGWRQPLLGPPFQSQSRLEQADNGSVEMLAPSRLGVHGGKASN